MVRLRNRDVTNMIPKVPVKNIGQEEDYDPIRLYQRYIHSLRMTPKVKENFAAPTLSSGAKTRRQPPRSVPSIRPIPIGDTLQMNARKSKLRTQVRSKPSLELQSSRVGGRPKTAQSKKKPVDNLEDYEAPAEKKVTFEPNEIECFFDALKETVEEVVEAKLTAMVDIVVDNLTKKIEEVSNKSQKLEEAFSTLCNEINNKITYYGEEHNRHFRYICMKLEYDKIFYQNLNNLIHPDQMRPAEDISVTQEPTIKLNGIPSKEFPNRSISGHSSAFPIYSHSNTTTATTTNNNQSHPQSCRVQKIQQVQDWSHQAGDSLKTTAHISQTARVFSHSPSSPFQHVTCQISRSCPKQMNHLLMANLLDQHCSADDEIDLTKRLGPSKSVDVAFVATGNDQKAQLGIKEFLDTLKVFQSNLGSRNMLDRGDVKLLDGLTSSKRNSALSLMETEDSISEDSSEGVGSNRISLVSSGGQSGSVVDNL